jgi:hypothetical protein
MGVFDKVKDVIGAGSNMVNTGAKQFIDNSVKGPGMIANKAFGKEYETKRQLPGVGLHNSRVSKGYSYTDSTGPSDEHDYSNYVAPTDSHSGTEKLMQKKISTPEGRKEHNKNMTKALEFGMEVAPVLVGAGAVGGILSRGKTAGSVLTKGTRPMRKVQKGKPTPVGKGKGKGKKSKTGKYLDAPDINMDGSGSGSGGSQEIPMRYQNWRNNT